MQMGRNMRAKACAGIASSEIGDLLWKAFLKLIVASIETEKPGRQQKKERKKRICMFLIARRPGEASGGREKKKKRISSPIVLCPVTHDRQVFVNQQTEQATTTPSTAPEKIFHLRRGTTNATLVWELSPALANHKSPTNSLRILLSFFPSSSCRKETIVPRSSQSAKNHHLTKPELNRHHLTCKLTTRNQTGNQSSPSTIPLPSFLGLGLQCNINAINPRAGRRKDAAESSGSREGRNGG